MIPPEYAFCRLKRQKAKMFLSDSEIIPYNNAFVNVEFLNNGTEGNKKAVIACCVV